MSRSGYNDYDGDDWALIRWRGAVSSAIRGRRGQTFLREMLASLDALSAPRLIKGDIATAEGEVCAIGAVARSRGMDASGLDPEDGRAVARAFGIAEAMAREIAFVNDEVALVETPERRFDRVRRWVVENLL